MFYYIVMQHSKYDFNLIKTESGWKKWHLSNFSGRLKKLWKGWRTVVKGNPKHDNIRSILSYSLASYPLSQTWNHQLVNLSTSIQIKNTGGHYIILWSFIEMKLCKVKPGHKTKRCKQICKEPFKQIKYYITVL